jgi:tripartite-type tricarboxylate transporter receptor subunit TctC
MTFLRRSIPAVLCAVVSASCAVSVFAQTYPTKPIRVVVPFPAGGGTDIIAREVTNKMAATLGWSFVIDNKPGSGGNLGVDAVAKAAPDGYTIALGQSSNLAINPSLFSKMPYDSVKDLAPIGLVASSPMVMVVGADSPLKTLADVVAASKAKPGSLNMATSGNGTVAHLSGEVFQKAAGIKFTHVPYKGAAQATTDLIGGQVQLSMSSIPTLIGHIRSGKMRPIAVTSLTRVDDIPQVPTIAESGYKGFETVTWFGFVAPANTPKDIVTRLNAEINKALQSPDVKKKLSDQGADILGGSPEKFGALIKSDIAYWAPVIKESGAKLD